MYWGYALGAALGPMDVKYLFYPLSFAIIAGVLSIAGYIWYQPSTVYFRAITLWCYTLPVVLLAIYAAYISVTLAYHSINKDEYNYLTIHGSRSTTLPDDGNDIFQIWEACLTNGLGQQKSCNNTYYIYIHTRLHDRWSYAGGGALSYIWKELNNEGNITRSSKSRELELEIKSGPVLSTKNHEAPLNSGDLIVITIDADWSISIRHGISSLNKLSLSKLTTDSISQCVRSQCLKL